MSIFAEIGFVLLSNIIQTIIGCILGIVVYRTFSGKVKNIPVSLSGDLLWIGLFSLAGMLLPLGLFGVIPVIAVFLSMGFQWYTLLPLIFSNGVFNMMTPWNDPGFVWRTGFERIVLALVVGMVVGIVLRITHFRGESLISHKKLSIPGEGSVGISNTLRFTSKNIYKMWIYIVIGVSADIIFHQYIMGKLINLVFANPYTSVIPHYFARLNVVNPLFLLTMIIVTMLMDLTRLSALTVIFKLKGIVFYFAYSAIWAIMLSISAFI